MCWSKHEREQWERERREAELEAERIRLVSATYKAAEPEPEFDEREEELVRGWLERLMTSDGRPVAAAVAARAGSRLRPAAVGDSRDLPGRGVDPV